MNVLKLLVALCLTSVLFMSTTCEGDDVETHDVLFENKSSQPVEICWWWFDQEHLLTPNDYYPSKKIGKGEKYCITGNKVEAIMNGKQKLQILVFRQSTLDEYSKEQLIRDEIFDKRYIISYEELKDRNFIVIYDDSLR